MPIQISPHYTDAKLARGCLINDKIDVFEDWMNGWHLVHAHALCAQQYNLAKDAGFAVLMLATAYFEPIESYYTGVSSHGKSQLFFKNGFLRVFRNLPATLRAGGFPNEHQLADEIASEVYIQLRCGLFHEGGARHKLIIAKRNIPLEVSVETTTHHIGSIIIDPYRFLMEIQNHLNLYVAALRDPSQTLLRTNFEKFFDQRISPHNHTVLPPMILTP